MALDLAKYINTSRSLKIWTIITHGLIFCGGGHGVFPIVFIEFFGLNTDSYFSPVAYFMLLGQILLVVLILLKELPTKVITHIVGLLLLWAAIIYFIWYALHHSHGMCCLLFS